MGLYSAQDVPQERLPFLQGTCRVGTWDDAKRLEMSARYEMLTVHDFAVQNVRITSSTVCNATTSKRVTRICTTTTRGTTGDVRTSASRTSSTVIKVTFAACAVQRPLGASDKRATSLSSPTPTTTGADRSRTAPRTPILCATEKRIFTRRRGRSKEG